MEESSCAAPSDVTSRTGRRSKPTQQYYKPIKSRKNLQDQASQELPTSQSKRSKEPRADIRRTALEPISVAVDSLNQPVVTEDARSNTAMLGKQPFDNNNGQKRIEGGKSDPALPKAVSGNRKSNGVSPRKSSDTGRHSDSKGVASRRKSSSTAADGDNKASSIYHQSNQFSNAVRSVTISLWTSHCSFK